PGINNIEAVSFLIPSGWTTEGGVKWFPDYSILANLLMTVSDPKTGAAIQFLPIQNFTWINQPVMPMQQGQNYMGNIVWQPIEEVPRFIQTFYANDAVRKPLMQAKMVEKEELSKVAEQITKNYGGQSRVKAERVRYEYERDGKMWEEEVYVT